MDVKAVQGTSDDAAVSKLCAAEKGYFDDKFLQYFVTKRAKRSPLINRGYYSRVAAFEIMVKDFLQNGPQPKICSPPAGSTTTSSQTTAMETESSSANDLDAKGYQIVCLGAGFDTTFFKVRKAGFKGFRYIEADLPDIAQRKAHIIRATAELRSLAGLDDEEGEEAGGDEEKDPSKKKVKRKKIQADIHTQNYHLVSCDLRDPKALDVAMEKCGADFSIPTLFLSECVLIYLEPKYSTGVIAWASKKSSNGGGFGRFVCYEQIRPDDPFGQIMIQNLQGRGCALRSLKAYPTLEAQVKRYRDCGWTDAQSFDMNTVYSKILDPKDKARIEKLEMFDEFEEWHLFGAHYALTIGTVMNTCSKALSSATPLA
eukprot:jgi/Bigna1/92490/estExt_fgenesh1_pm.C_270011